MAGRGPRLPPYPQPLLPRHPPHHITSHPPQHITPRNDTSQASHHSCTHHFTPFPYHTHHITPHFTTLHLLYRITPCLSHHLHLFLKIAPSLRSNQLHYYYHYCQSSQTPVSPQLLCQIHISSSPAKHMHATPVSVLQHVIHFTPYYLKNHNLHTDSHCCLYHQHHTTSTPTPFCTSHSVYN